MKKQVWKKSIGPLLAMAVFCTAIPAQASSNTDIGLPDTETVTLYPSGDENSPNISYKKNDNKYLAYVSGKVTLTLPNVPQELEAETTSGDVTLTLSAQPAAPVALRFQTVSGVFRSDIDSADNAANVWELQTVSGSVTVSAAA